MILTLLFCKNLLFTTEFSPNYGRFTYSEVLFPFFIHFSAFSDNKVDDEAEHKDLAAEYNEHERTNVAIKPHHMELVQ